MRLGFSLSPQMILGTPDEPVCAGLLAYFGNPQRLLLELRDHGISSVEIRYMPRQMDEERSKRVLHTIWDAGLEVSIHGHVSGEFTGISFAHIYPPLKEALQHFGRHQKEITIPIHAYAASGGTREELSRRTVDLFREWTTMIEAEGLPVLFGIELNRKKPETVDPGDTCDGVSGMVDAIKSPHVGITWDMGHYYSNVMNGSVSGGTLIRPYDQLPATDFLERTVHTHIHGLGAKGTHGPLTDQDSLPLESYVAALKRSGYRGIYNLELDFSRFPENSDWSKHLFSSIERLRCCVAASETEFISE